METSADKREQRRALRRAGAPVAKYDDALPITARREDIIAAIRDNPVVVVAGETGSGKTTQLPRYCLEAGRGIDGQVACTQPRRIAARAMATRVAEELGVKLGEQVGYQVRFRDHASKDGYIKFMTDGLLLAEAMGDPLLRAYDTILIDEAHERSLNIDFLLGYLKRLLPRRPDLRVVITSATIDTEKFSKHFGDAPVIEVSGRGYPVDIVYQPLDESDGGRDDDRGLYQGIRQAVQRLDRIDPRGDILVFLSGEREIHEARDFLNRASLRHTEVLPLYARLSGAEQQRVFHPGPERRIILTTNIAETSLTVPRIKFVIDSGLARISRYAHRSRTQRLPIEPVSQASANQRAGRCGRLGPGTCVRLYDEADFESRPEFTEPEILRTSLASVILRMLSMGLGEIEEFPFLEPPAPRMINDARHLLFELGAVDAARELTRTGDRLSRWPVDVRFARIIEEGARLGCLEDTLVLAAALSIQDPRERPLEARQAADEAHARFDTPGSDFAALLALWQHLRKQRRSLTGNQFRKACRREFLAWQRVLEWFDLYQQLRDLAREARLPLKGGHGDDEKLHIALLSGLLSHVGLKHPEGHGYEGARGRGFHIFPGSGLFKAAPKWVMAAEIVETTKTWARVNARVKPEWIERQGAHLLKRTHFDPHWSRRRGRVMAWEQVTLYGLVLAEKRRVDFARIDPAEARRIFIMDALVRGELDTRAGFAKANRAAREAVERLEHKRRQRDVLADERDLFEYFDTRVPDQVNSAKSLAKWLDGLGEKGRDQLVLGQDVLLRDDAGRAPEDLYPDQLEVAGRRLPMTYLFEPGNPNDGVTVTVPLELLNTLDAARLSWTVPGLQREKLVEMMRTLPKPVRRALTPLPQFAEAAAGQLGEPGSRSLAERLATVLSDLGGVNINAADFDESRLPDHLRMRVVVLGEEGETAAEGRDLDALQAKFGAQAQRQFMDRQGEGFNRDGLLEWSVGELPVKVRGRDRVDAYPALVDQDDAVGLRLFDTADEAAAYHVEGVHRLLALALADRLSSLRKHHGVARDAMLAWTPWGDALALVDDLAWHVLYGAAGDEAVAVRDEAAFVALADRVRRDIGPLFQRQARRLGEVLATAAAIQGALDGKAGANHPDAAADLQAALDDLVYPGFLLDLGPKRLAEYPRYLEATSIRLEQLRLDPPRDTRLQAEIAPLWDRYARHLEAGAAYDEAVDRYRWLLHEYRVSVFAQRLGTAEKVSTKRLQSAWRDVTDATPR
ncbi:ATP-dependent RNA helicase HrpA [Marinihelvus fidelis]|uniref:ATP-dependent RNA helicase HrpA n=1 Tax=Marinihelvus fidelis TaxID=2613842 RepID=A0A5N0TH22_9GAMM|nr:ATP-dependent RNA helicase HrpA [Marinihelvus fidelis]KAA9133437.1 ATP-dependent RNA helicase HrpA [Marinihelvus fidelis]